MGYYIDDEEDHEDYDDDMEDLYFDDIMGL